MAKSSKNKSDQEKPEVEPVEPVEMAAEDQMDATAASDGADQNNEAPVDEPATGVEDEGQSNDTRQSNTEGDDADDDDAGPFPAEDEDQLTEESVDSAATDTVAPPETPTPQVAPAKSTTAGFFPLLLGGVAAGSIGYGIGQYDPSGNTDYDAVIAAQAARIVVLEDQVAAADIAPVLSQVAEIESTLHARLAGLTDEVQARITGIETRLTDLERRPNADGTLSDVALSAYQAELETLRAELDAQRQEVTDLAAQAQADLEAARAESATIEQQAIATAQAAAARAAINRIAAAAETGAPFADALADPSLDSVEIPQALTEVLEAGVPTAAALATTFPDAARAALAAARNEGQSDDVGGLGGFLRNQFDVRSTTPREGSGPDAVLSRAEAAIKGGRIADALAEIEVLPEVARAAMTEWTAQAQSRSDVLAAIASLSETLNSN